MLAVLPDLDAGDDALFYLRAPSPEYKDAYADWITPPDRRTPEIYAAFEQILERLEAVLEAAGAEPSERQSRRAG